VSELVHQPSRPGIQTSATREEAISNPECAVLPSNEALHPMTPGYWLTQAADAVALAEDMHDPRAKHSMMLIARGYEKLAEHAARLARLNLPNEQAEVDQSD
jgi:hypothetical protein